MIVVPGLRNTSPGFCVASSRLVTSSGANCQNTLQDATVSAPIQLLSTPYIRGMSPVVRPCPLTKRTNQTAVGAAGEADDAALFAVVDALDDASAT